MLFEESKATPYTILSNSLSHTLLQLKVPEDVYFNNIIPPSPHDPFFPVTIILLDESRAKSKLSSSSSLPHIRYHNSIPFLLNFLRYISVYPLDDDGSSILPVIKKLSFESIWIPWA